MRDKSQWRQTLNQKNKEIERSLFDTKAEHNSFWLIGLSNDLWNYNSLFSHFCENGLDNSLELVHFMIKLICNVKMNILDNISDIEIAIALRILNNDLVT